MSQSFRTREKYKKVITVDKKGLTLRRNPITILLVKFVAYLRSVLL